MKHLCCNVTEQRLNKEHLLCSFCFQCYSHKCGWMGNSSTRGKKITPIVWQVLTCRNVLHNPRKAKCLLESLDCVTDWFQCSIEQMQHLQRGKIPTNSVQLNTSQIQKDGPDVLQRWTNIWLGQHPVCTLCSKALAIRLKTPTESCRSKTPTYVNWWKITRG